MDHHQQAAGYNRLTWTSTSTKRKHEYVYASWEEQAFAEDALGLLGSSGCVWPPRSYTCSFCKREFSSAQALGGHMNVHRRDRAKLKQLPNTPQHETQNPKCNNHDYPLIHKKCPNPNPNSSSFLEKSSCLFIGPFPKDHHKRRDDKNEAKNIAESKLSISLSLFVEEANCFKKRKVVTISPERTPPLIFSSEVSKEIDLELRLGW